jgi:hypothetical protein
MRSSQQMAQLLTSRVCMHARLSAVMLIHSVLRTDLCTRQQGHTPSQQVASSAQRSDSKLILAFVYVTSAEAAHL